VHLPGALSDLERSISTTPRYDTFALLADALALLPQGASRRCAINRSLAIARHRGVMMLGNEPLCCTGSAGCGR
jgi:hypothetical protein